jgi:hypothetical protein
MKQHNMFILIRQGATGFTGRQWPCLFRSLGRPLAICSALMQCLSSVQASDALPVREPDTQTGQVQKTVYNPQGHQMERYKAFARQAELPPITITNHSVLEVGGVMNVDAARLAQLSKREMEALAGQFRVPVDVIDKLVQRLTPNSPPAPEQFAREIRTAVIDYRFLQIEWERYHPPEQGQKTKAAALAALQSGNIGKAWELYDGLSRPQPPSIAAPAPPANLRVIAQP